MSDSCPTPLKQVPPSLRRVIVAGFGPVGRVITEQLRAQGVQVVIIDMNSSTIATQQRQGHRAVLGDVTDPAVLTAADIAHADALILAVPNEDSAVAACAQARRLAPKIFIAARTNFVSRGMLASKAGADHVTVEEIVTAQAMRDAVVGHFFESDVATSAE